MLDPSEVLELVKKAQSGDEKSKEILINENSSLIKSVIKRFLGKGIEYDDLYQLGCLGFLKALKNFDSSFDVKFSTYVVPMVIGEIKRFMRDDGAIKVSRALKTLNISIKKYIDEYYLKNKEKPSIEVIAGHFNVDQQDIIMAMEASKMPVSLYAPLEGEDSDLLMIDRIDLECSDKGFIDKIAIKEVIQDLCERDRKIILMRYFYDKTQNEIAKKLGISQVQVSRLENKILDGLKSKLS